DDGRDHAGAGDVRRAEGLRHPDLGHPALGDGDGVRHGLGRVADHPHHGHAPDGAAADPRLRGRDNRRHRDRDRLAARLPAQHDEIFEQPAVVARLLDAETAPVRALARNLASRRFDYVLIAARGTSDNAARYAQYLFGVALGLPVALATPSLHTLYGARLRFDGALVLGI